MTRDRNTFDILWEREYVSFVVRAYRDLRWRVTTPFHSRCTHMRECVCASPGATAITYGVTAGRVLKKPMTRLRERLLLLSRHARCRKSQRARDFTIVFDHTSPPSLTFQKAAGYNTGPPLLGTSRSISLLNFVFDIESFFFFFQNYQIL